MIQPIFYSNFYICITIIEGENRATMLRKGSGHYSDSPLLRRPIIPTAHCSDSPFLRQRHDKYQYQFRMV